MLQDLHISACLLGSGYTTIHQVSCSLFCCLGGGVSDGQGLGDVC